MESPHGLGIAAGAVLTRRITLLSVATAAVLVSLKVVVWLASGSVALLASAADSGLDLVAALGTFFAVRLGVAIRAASGLLAADASAGLLVTAILLVGAIQVFRDASNQLMDHELPDAERARIVDLMTADPRLTDVHQLRTRAAGPYVH